MVGNSVKYLFFTLLLGVVVGFVLGWTVRRPVPVVVREPVTDTLRIPVPVPPDIVTIEYPGLGFDSAQPPGYAQPPGFDGAQPPGYDLPPDVVFVDTGGVRIDTVFVDSSRFRRPVFRSEKYFAFDYVESWMTAYAAAPVDSFDHRLVIDWNGFVQERVAPEMGLRLRGEKQIGRMQGFLAGVVVSAGLGWLVLR